MYDFIDSGLTLACPNSYIRFRVIQDKIEEFSYDLSSTSHVIIEKKKTWTNDGKEFSQA